MNSWMYVEFVDLYDVKYFCAFQTVGCDQRIGSHEQLDVCGVCGGDNSTCNTTSDVAGVFSDTRLSPGNLCLNCLPSKT
jgi:hypothetical protein